MVTMAISAVRVRETMVSHFATAAGRRFWLSPAIGEAAVGRWRWAEAV